MIEHKTLDNWFVGQIQIDDDFSPIVPVVRGFVDGKFIKFAPLLWLDLDKKIIMTDVDTYKIGSPNEKWMTRFLAEGNAIKDLEIKDIVH
jgi:hypothetical protein